MKDNDLILIVDPDRPRRKWPLWRVLGIFCGAYGRVRVAKIQVGNKTLKGPLTKLCQLEFSQSKINSVNKEKAHPGEERCCGELWKVLETFI